MYEDPIVKEVRKAGQRLEEQSGGDLHTFFEFLRKTQQQYKGRLVHTVLRVPQITVSPETPTTLLNKNPIAESSD